MGQVLARMRGWIALAVGALVVCLFVNQWARDVIGTTVWYARLLNLTTGVVVWVSMMLLSLWFGLFIWNKMQQHDEP